MTVGKSIRLRIAALCILSCIAVNTYTVWAANEGDSIVINKSTDIKPDTGSQDSVISFEEPENEITINVTTAGDSVDNTRDEVLENANSLVTEINVEVPASFHIDPNARIGKGIYADDVDLSGLT